jgi:epoxyqueuosine reductase
MKAPVTRSLETRIRAQAFGLGFDLVGIARLGPVETSGAFDDWLTNGFAGEMHYLERGAEKRRDTRRPVAGARSAVVVALDYGGRQPAGPVARYARGQDYHGVLAGKLTELHRWLEAEIGHSLPGKPYVDTGPVLERDLARRAGLGWFGKNTNLIHPRVGSFFFLGALLLDHSLEPDAPFVADRCGSCTRCLDACPTHAFVAPHVLDATQCISYLTIEFKGAIPEPLRARMGSWIYGCDICQDVCPWNVRFAREIREPAFAPRAALAQTDARRLARELMTMDDAAFRTAFQDSPVTRAKRRGLARNAAVALGNIGDPGDVDVLAHALDDAEPLVRGHAAWALGRIGTAEAAIALRARAAGEPDEWVLEELTSALTATVRATSPDSLSVSHPEH